MISIASDHRGVELKKEVMELLKQKKIAVRDLGPETSEVSVDYPDYALKVAISVANGKTERGIVICHSGIGVSVTANKVKGVRAALCQTVEQAELSRLHTDANVLALPAGFISKDLAKQIVAKWLETAFEGGRHERRLNEIKKFEDGKK
ncbi:MAG: ribose 5-phosphate isomerase B [Omnitrophica bacterium RIFCSPLOWO2_12_FULL_44_17]|uniref:Ribose 5-phosphate isomerase B n=1 Tax=Candidatus Danuiimicrobium aquiferis TaxID=1801832 RepID=A0A1G1KWH1_9BACT|nr:MAG: ribose 5-phosphate isomerase B [Omnitrophica bacterium RIFCSPHIGHO2_02_FULL_45_28]OGW90271.1 MAG: ribose 5-phosphate isomerase B [Omnitrophica bacterium RIFCSPHIGHO2_12_FULL_44_12]OGW97240.1 MAG: ribose 5-phosphate isomerase B [Omnitrophica bacterium RIFCSPLOWO2_12_FULL_44_17]OGX02295.1 MAG: ribose 5-phosphate isomerase B [Omnitrophica bacterium RIFCSPLOWO2_02_FULL_44_11]